ncbi:DNA primase [uncultured Muribaculum sp.]|uniref:DNA primase n=1 Tax=uncultured Muribaculum sp. TaxID=1918613 RepID=UPI0025B1EBC3|nr:DNA primase [uncultured Muribaculum sp.]
MRTIDRETVQRILDTADIVEVVSDFVTLKRRGTSYLGLCPFHNERTPSFSVSKSKNICKCFSCGKGGSPVNFIMEHEHMTYQEALRYLAKKYGIEIKEHEMTSQERERESQRASLLAVNDFALKHFEDNLFNTDEGREVGLSYFRQRGLNEAVINKFHLGYALERSNALYASAMEKGFTEDNLVTAGLCIRTDSNRVYDRFKGRVIYPVFSLSGKIIAFGGRTLKKDVAKYVNSPESVIYVKSNELYGIYQSKSAISKLNKCILVEGYMDVISMHQSGVENVVASSGTSLTEGQIRLIHRFAENVTVIYDGDAAGIKASLRGIDMLLAEGLNIKVLLLPDGHDPDSFAQSRSASELEAYINEHETDFIKFKTDILLKGVENDPMARARAITDIVHSIAVIPNPVSTNLYITECSRMLRIDEGVIRMEVTKQRADIAEKESLRVKQQKARESLKNGGNPQAEIIETESESVGSASLNDTEVSQIIARSVQKTDNSDSNFLLPYEKWLLQLVLRYGVLDLCDEVDGEGNSQSVNVIEYVRQEMQLDSIVFTNEAVAKTFDAALELARKHWPSDKRSNDEVLMENRRAYIVAGEEDIRNSLTDLADLERRRKELTQTADDMFCQWQQEYAQTYIERILCSDADSQIRGLALELVPEKYVLSKMHTKYARIETDMERLEDLVPRAIFALKDAVLTCRDRALRELLRCVVEDGSMPDNEKSDKMFDLLAQRQQITLLRSELAKYLGDRIFSSK